MLSFELLCFIEQRPRAQLKVLQISPNSSFVALGQPLKLNVTVNNVTQPRYYRLYIYWSFRRFSSTPFEELAKALWHVDQDKVSTDSHDSRASIVDNATLELVNTTLHDSGTYQCLITSYENKYSTTRYLYFNVTIEGRLLFLLIIYMKKCCNSHWLRAVQLIPNSAICVITFWREKNMPAAKARQKTKLHLFQVDFRNVQMIFRYFQMIVRFSK